MFLNFHKCKHINFSLVLIVTGDGTFYDLGLTACGQTFTNDDLVAAVSFSRFTAPNPNNDPMCQKKAKITEPTSGKSVIVSIKDKCAGCKENDIDMSKGAFQKISSLDKGRITVNWDFV